MPVGGGNHKIPGDGTVVSLRPDATLGNADIWDMRDVVIALMDERNDLRAAVAASVTYAAFQAAVAALPKYVVTLDSLDQPGGLI